jgi:hypothetical protein
VGPFSPRTDHHVPRRFIDLRLLCGAYNAVLTRKIVSILKMVLSSTNVNNRKRAK